MEKTKCNLKTCDPTKCPQLHTPEKVKPLAQYLGEYIDYETGEVGHDASDWWCKLFIQALDAYESTENVVIQIIKKKAR